MKRVVIIVLVVITSGFLLLDWALFGNRSSFQAGLTRYEGLPPSAKDISVFQSKNISGNFVADFSIPENDFVAFAAERHWSLAPIVYSKYISSARGFHDERSNDRTITNGLFYEKRAPNGGGITVGYDRTDRRAYINSSSR